MKSPIVRLVVPLAGAALVGASTMAVGGSPAHAADSQPATATTAAPCGHSIGPARPGSPVRLVSYKHCGSGSVRVKAIINWGPDSDCVTVGSYETRGLITYIPPASFERIDRC